MNWILIKSQEDLEKLTEEFDWPDAFIREAHLVSPSYVQEDGSTVAPNSLPCLRVLAVTADSRALALEMLFSELREMSLWFEGDMKPSGLLTPSGCSWRFHKDIPHELHCRELRYRWLEDACRGHGLKYGWEELFDRGGLLEL